MRGRADDHCDRDHDGDEVEPLSRFALRRLVDGVSECLEVRFG